MNMVFREKTEIGLQQAPDTLVPPDKHTRDRLKALSAEYVCKARLVGPLSARELEQHAERVLSLAGSDAGFIKFTAILVNNATWRAAVAAAPYERRLLLLPRCLRHAESCHARMDDFGFVCMECGACVIGEFQREARRLGYAVLVAEGAPIVMSLVASGKVEAVVGVGCMEALEGVFPYMEAGAVPGIAVPLLCDGCAGTMVDTDWVWEAIYRNSGAESGRMNISEIKEQVNSWFGHEVLEPLLSSGESPTAQLALDWLCKAGKRWRPILLACAYRALVQSNDPMPESVLQAAVAVECFHKASLVHDDIEDDDALRYGQKTMHAAHGVPIALNVGDYLIGEGYLLLSELDAPDHAKARLISCAARGHTTLCRGQGGELMQRSRSSRPTLRAVIDIFREKTAPAFQVALELGASLAGADESILPALKAYSEALGVAYQIRDDLLDGTPGGTGCSILPALAYESANAATRRLLDSARRPDAHPDRVMKSEVEDIIAAPQVRAAACDLMEDYKLRALNALAELKNSDFKSLLRIVISNIFDELEITVSGHDDST